jgi:pimeloyl-ACP methyl ester carboxylesterase
MSGLRAVARNLRTERRDKEMSELKIERKAPSPSHAVVFVHGILSSHGTFDSMIGQFTKDKRFSGWDVGYFDYDYWQTMQDSARQLRDDLVREFSAATPSLTLVCHSMGGLVARFAVLLHRPQLPFLKRIVMLGTPNFGAIRPAQMAVLAQVGMNVFRTVYGLFTRKTGVLDLTLVQKQFEQSYKNGQASNARDVEYVTIPGLYYYSERFSWEAAGDSVSRAMTMMNLGAEWLTLTLPGAAVRVTRPHDGIVEASSVRMDSDESGRYSEKHASIHNPRFKQPPTYAHIEHGIRSKELTHVTIQKDQLMIDVVKGILLAGGAAAWRDGLGPSAFDYAISIPE